MSVEFGNFSFITDPHDRTLLEDMFQAVTKADKWNEIKEDPGEGGFMFGDHTLAENILHYMRLADQHSGASFALCMRTLQAISRNGWNSWVENYISQNQGNESNNSRG